MNGIDAIGPFTQDDLFRFSVGLVTLLVAIMALSILAALLTRVAFDLGGRAIANRIAVATWAKHLPLRAKSFFAHIVFDDRRGSSLSGDESRLVLPWHLAALHPQRLAAQVANKLHAMAEVDHGVMKVFLSDLDGLSDHEREGTLKDDQDVVDAAPWQEAHEEELADPMTLRRAVAARIDAVVDGLQVRLARDTMLAGYLVALISALVIGVLAYPALGMPLRTNSLLYALLAAFFAGFVAALIHARFDRPTTP